MTGLCAKARSRALEVCLMIKAVLRRCILWAALLVTAAGASPAWAAELVMFDAPSCVYCKKFKREAMGPYNESPAAQVLPLRIVQMDHDELWFRLKRPVASTPTFVIVERGREVERFAGYSGREDFLDTMNSLVDAYKKYMR
jgi:thioredoxin-related protein